MSNQNQKTAMHIQVTEPQQFEPLTATAFETTQKLAKRINKLFATAFVDYHGSVVTCTAGNGNVANSQLFMVELHFKPLTAGSVEGNDGRVRAFRPIGEDAKKDDIVSGLRSIYGSIRSTSAFELTEDAAEILSEFMITGTNIDPFKPASYDPFKAEYRDNGQYGQQPIMVKITNLDLIKLIKKIYGGKDADGNKVDYGIIPQGPVMPNMNNTVANSANWRVMIMQVSAERTFELASELGIIPAGNGGGAVVTAMM